MKFVIFQYSIITVYEFLLNYDEFMNVSNSGKYVC